MLPYVQDRRREIGKKSPIDARAFLNCGDCRHRMRAAVRQTWNCGHLPRLPHNRYQGPLLDAFELAEDTTCPGYLTALPQVLEAAEAVVWWDKGQLRDLCDGEQPTPLMRTCVSILAGAQSQALAAALRPKEGAGA